MSRGVRVRPVICVATNEFGQRAMVAELIMRPHPAAWASARGGASAGGKGIHLTDEEMVLFLIEPALAFVRQINQLLRIPRLPERSTKPVRVQQESVRTRRFRLTCGIPPTG